MKDSTADSANDTGLPALLGYISNRQTEAMVIEKLLDAAMVLYCSGDPLEAIGLLDMAQARATQLNRDLDSANLPEVQPC